jgi:phosphoribosyl 1,2-cyclic phosphodiesterase
MGLTLTLLGSGSTGNAALVSDGVRHVLVDVGISGRETRRRLAECGLEPGDISAIVVSHEHGDHCRGIAPFVKDLDVPVFMTDGAYDAYSSAEGPLFEARKRQRIESGCAFDVHGMLFTPFAVPHDAADPLGFCIERDGVKIGIVLDLGYVSNLVIERLRGCDALVLESNHDLNMLKVGPYPWQLKQRVMSRRGHLSNDGVAEYLRDGFDGRARNIILAHLSEKNNLPELARLSAQRALEERSALLAVQSRVDIARPDRVSAAFKY